jgi:hypothetical protein
MTEILRRIKGSKIAKDWDDYRKRTYPNQSLKDVTNIDGNTFIKDYLLDQYSSEVDTYKRTDKLMNLGTEISPGDKIYIDCKPTNTYGEEIKPDENIGDIAVTNVMFDELSNKLNNPMLGKTILDNIGFQILVGIILLAIIYFIGNVIFLKYPKKIVNAKNNTLNPPSE